MKSVRAWTDMPAVQRTYRTIRDIVAGTAYLQYIL